GGQARGVGQGQHGGGGEPHERGRPAAAGPHVLLRHPGVRAVPDPALVDLPL
ncbi:unnamed protein product, partial [Heterosigma akashiwo]